MTTHAERVQEALKLAFEDGQAEGEHHKAWIIDQMVRILAGDDYGDMIAEYRAGEDGPETYWWDTGTAP